MPRPRCLRSWPSAARAEFSDLDWRRLAAQHPLIAADALAQQAARVDSFDQRLLWQANAVLPQLARHAPDHALALLPVLLAHISLAQLELQALAYQRPAEIVDLLLQSGDQAELELGELAHRLDLARLRALLGRGLLDYALEVSTTGSRLELHAARSMNWGGWRDSEGGAAGGDGERADQSRSANRPLYKDATAPIEQRVDDLLSRMTQEERSRRS